MNRCASDRASARLSQISRKLHQPPLSTYPQFTVGTGGGCRGTRVGMRALTGNQYLHVKVCRVSALSTSTTLADLLTLRVVAKPFSTMRAALRWWSGEEFEDGVSHGGQSWLRRWAVDSFFPASPF